MQVRRGVPRVGRLFPEPRHASRVAHEAEALPLRVHVGGSVDRHRRGFRARRLPGQQRDADLLCIPAHHRRNRKRRHHRRRDDNRRRDELGVQGVSQQPERAEPVHQVRGRGEQADGMARDLDARPRVLQTPAEVLHLQVQQRSRVSQPSQRSPECVARHANGRGGRHVRGRDPRVRGFQERVRRAHHRHRGRHGRPGVRQGRQGVRRGRARD